MVYCTNKFNCIPLSLLWGSVCLIFCWGVWSIWTWVLWVLIDMELLSFFYKLISSYPNTTFWKCFHFSIFLYFETVACLAQKSRMESRRHFGRKPSMINVPYTKQQTDWLFQNSDAWAIVLTQFKSQINNNLPAVCCCNLHNYIFLFFFYGTQKSFFHYSMQIHE